MTQRDRTVRNGKSATIAEIDPLPVLASDAEVDPGSAVDQLSIVPRLGPTRRRMLSEAGINTLDALRSVPLEDLAQIKYVGIGNARLIKAWLEKYDSSAAADSMPPEPPDLTIIGKPEDVRTSLPASEKPFDLAPAPAPIGAGDQLSANAPPDVEPAVEVQNASAYSSLETIDRAVASLKDRLPKKERHPKLKKQLSRIGTSLSEARNELEEGHRAEAIQTLESIGAVIGEAQGASKLGEKKQKSLGTKLKRLLKRLDGLTGK